MANDPTKKSKGEIRKEIKRRLREQDPNVRAQRSLIIQNKLLSSEFFRKCRTVMFYVSLPDEVDTTGLIKEALKLKKRVVVPFIADKGDEILVCEITSFEGLEKGPFGVLQPKTGQMKTVPLEEIDLIVVPALAYDMNKMRLGRGKGYFDRFLSRQGLSSARTMGLAFSFQVLETLPHDDHDRPVGGFLTD